MPRFLTIGYGDEAGYRSTPCALRAAAHANDANLIEEGAIVGRAGSPVQVRNPAAEGVETERGAYLHAGLPLAGFALIEADSLDHAVSLVAKSPCAVAQGVIEVWPLLEN